MSSRAVQTGATERRKTIAVLGLLLLISFMGINRDLWTPDEPREAEISREMALDPGVVPTLNGRPFIEKPPLYYWTVASIFALTGEASAPLARSVSMGASFLTLLIVFLWGRREFSSDVGLVAAIGLAASVQFMISSHWVLIDPLLMLFTTLAAWAGWELVQGRGGLPRALQFYLALAMALWIKGLIGPVLFAFGLLAYVVWMHSLKPIVRVYPVTGVMALLAATGVLAFLIYLEAGSAAVREWLWVNHVQRFIDPEYTGHEQPFYYYLHTLPTAIFPWWIPLADCLRPSRWRADTSSWKPLKVYLAAMCLGMTLILSASATKRGIYLLPLLPLLALLLAAHSVQWWQRQSAEFGGSSAWWFQIALVGLLAATPVFVGLVYLHSTEGYAIAFLAFVAALTVGLVVLSRRRDWSKALAVLGLYALSGVVGLMLVTAHLAAPLKDMTPFVQWFDAEIPANTPIYAVGNVDETLEAIVPFVTGRLLIEIMADEVPRLGPNYILVQDKEGGETAPQFGPPYEFLRDRGFGPGRYFAIWRRSDD
jgi:4-amino-4-deoxy-L-arabinose transferase-like glycosyltransferase